MYVVGLYLSQIPVGLFEIKMFERLYTYLIIKVLIGFVVFVYGSVGFSDSTISIKVSSLFDCGQSQRGHND